MTPSAAIARLKRKTSGVVLLCLRAGSPRDYLVCILLFPFCFILLFFESKKILRSGGVVGNLTLWNTRVPSIVLKKEQHGMERVACSRKCRLRLRIKSPRHQLKKRSHLIWRPIEIHTFPEGMNMERIPPCGRTEGGSQSQPRTFKRMLATAWLTPSGSCPRRNENHIDGPNCGVSAISGSKDSHRTDRERLTHVVERMRQKSAQDSGGSERTPTAATVRRASAWRGRRLRRRPTISLLPNL